LRIDSIHCCHADFSDRRFQLNADINLKELLSMRTTDVSKSIQRLWLRIIESHYTISAETEENIAREAQKNASYFQKQAALARSKRAALR
jgi:hypothetical protein